MNMSSGDIAVIGAYFPDAAAMKERDRPDRGTRPRLFGWCSRSDVVAAFRVVNQEIRLKFERLNAQSLTLADACQLARRVKDQRDLIRQLADSRNRRHARRLLRLNRQHRERLLRIVQEAGLDASALLFK